MGLLGVLFLCCGVFGIACASKCVAGTAKCSQYWVKLETHKHLFESEEELDEWCSHQRPFYECLESVLLAGTNGSLSELPTNLLISKLFAEDLCTDVSKSRKRYLDNAPCINQLNTELCFEPQYMDIVTDDGRPSSCSPPEKIYACIAATMIQNCGFDAGRVHRNLLKITRYSDEVCDIELPPGIGSCDKRDSKEPEVDEKVSGLYYGLVDRMGSIPEQEASYAERLGESEETTEEEAITEAIRSALDVLDEDVLSDEAVVETADLEEYTFSQDPEIYMKYPHITRIYKDILFYNYSSLEYALYWRQPAFNKFENLTCKHLQPSFLRGIIFRCVQEFRTKDPDCVSNSTVHEPVTPELIRDVDPAVPADAIVEFGPRPHWTKEFDDAVEEKRLRDMKSTTVPSEESPNTDSPTLTTASTLLYLAEAVTRSPLPSWLRLNQSFVLPDDILFELVDILQPPEDFGKTFPMNTYQIGNAMYNFIYHPMTNAIENMTCSRLDECHPRAKGLFKCKMMRREIEVCEECYGGTGAYVEGLPDPLPTIRPLGQKYAYMVSKATEPTETYEGSGFSEETPEDEMIALVLSGDEKTETSDKDEPLHNDVGESSYLIDQALNAEELENLESSNAEDDSSVHLVVLNQDSVEDRIGDSAFLPKLVYEVETDVVDDEQVPELTANADDGYRLLNEDILVFQAVPSEDDAKQYTIVNT